MRQLTTRNRLAVVAARGGAILAACLLVSACLKHDPDLVEKRNPAEWRADTYRVSFGLIDTRLDAKRRAGIDRWIGASKLARDEFVVVVVQDNPDFQAAAIQRRRAESVVRHLSGLGVPVSNVLATEDPSLLGTTKLLIGRPRVESANLRRACGKMCIELVTVSVPAAPVCTDWIRVRLGGDMRGSRRTFGCVVDSAVRSMVVDNRDLVRGRQPGPADAATMGLGVRDYRTGKLEINQPTATKTTDVGANSTGGGNK